MVRKNQDQVPVNQSSSALFFQEAPFRKPQHVSAKRPFLPNPTQIQQTSPGSGNVQSWFLVIVLAQG